MRTRQSHSSKRQKRPAMARGRQILSSMIERHRYDPACGSATNSEFRCGYPGK
jgi:NADH pyrophosphatase NudC (nudix superfamily)